MGGPFGGRLSFTHSLLTILTAQLHCYTELNTRPRLAGVIGMKRKSVRKVLVNGAAYLFSLILLLSMVAAPVIASVSANSVGTYHIKDNSILNKDIRPNKISS